MAIQLQIRRDTAANWTSTNPTLASGEIGFETDTARLKIGDGATAWTSLAYIIPASADTTTKTDNYTVLTTDFGQTFIMNAANKTFTLPSVAAGDVGAILTFVFIGTGTLTIDAADTDTIDDSGAGDTIYCTQNGEKYSTITLMLASATAWIILSAKGIWTTTD